ncbi:MAG: GHMP kinase [Flavobacterium sp.]|nr:MAG: GHMP kinase [Flavobacterium sp.]
MQSFHSNGKLLLTGEYTVLDGGLGLAIPTSYGQSLSVKNIEDKGLVWKSYNADSTLWYKGSFKINESVITTENKDQTSVTLCKILQQAMKLNPDFLNEESGFFVETSLNFPRQWGLGTSSTLINNIAQWAKVDAFKLLEYSFGGSGYDIAAARNDSPILYSNKGKTPHIRPINLPWEFTNRLFFVYLNKKQDSKEGIARYKEIARHKETARAKIDLLTEQVTTIHKLEVFRSLLEQHETIISRLLQLPKIKDELFPDYPGLVKSLGAWGGDFVLVSGGKDDLDYYRNKGYTTIIPFAEMLK